MAKPTYVRVRTDNAEFSVVESALPHYENAEVLDKPGANATGDPYPPKLRLRTSKASSQSSSAKGRKASTTTEEETS